MSRMGYEILIIYIYVLLRFSNCVLDIGRDCILLDAVALTNGTVYVVIEQFWISIWTIINDITT